MATSLYNSRAWRDLPRDGTCAVSALVGGACSGPLHLHHVTPLALGGDFDSDTVLVCARHHPMVEALARRVHRRRRCTHRHFYPGARAECERRLNDIR